MALHRYGDFRVEVFYFDSPCTYTYKPHKKVIVKNTMSREIQKKKVNIQCAVDIHNSRLGPQVWSYCSAKNTSVDKGIFKKGSWIWGGYSCVLWVLVASCSYVYWVVSSSNTLWRITSLFVYSCQLPWDICMFYCNVFIRISQNNPQSVRNFYLLDFNQSINQKIFKEICFSWFIMLQYPATRYFATSPAGRFNSFIRTLTTRNRRIHWPAAGAIRSIYYRPTCVPRSRADI